MPIDCISQYIDTVCAQIRWSKAKAPIAEELLSHLQDQCDAFTAQGIPEPEASARAVAEMGDAVAVGTQLDRTHRPKPQYGALFMCVLLFVAGFFARLSLLSHSTYFAQSTTVMNGILAGAVGVFLLFLFYWLDFTMLERLAMPLFGAFVLLQLATMFFGTNINGIPWLFSVFSLRHLSLLAPMCFALLLYAMRGKGMCGFFIALSSGAVLLCIILIAPYMAGAMFFALIAFGLVLTAVLRGWFGDTTHDLLSILVCISVGVLLLFGVILLQNRYIFTYLADRFFTPDPNGAGYVTYFIRDVLAHSEWLGAGTGVTADCGILADFELTLFAYAYGKSAALGVVACLFSLLAFGFYKVYQVKNSLGFYLGFAILGTFTLQSALYVAQCFGIFDISTAFAPFFVYGKMSLWVNAVLMGILLSILRTGFLLKDTVMVRQQA